MTRKQKIRAATDKLYNAVAEFVALQHGNVKAIAGTSVNKFPGDPDEVFRITVACIGDPPKADVGTNPAKKEAE